MSDETERMQILNLIESGKITAEEGIRLLQALDGQGEPDAGPITGEIPESEGLPPPERARAFSASDEPIPPPSPPALPESAESSPNQNAEEVVTPLHPVMPSNVERWRKWWMVLVWIGVALTLVGAMLMFFAWQATRFSFWFACTWVPFLLGVGVIVFALASSRMRWLHLRVYQGSGEWPRKISISLPLPIRFIAWLVKVFGRYSKDVREKGIDQMIVALEKTNPDEPFFLEVDDEDGDRVEIYIG